MTKFYVVLQLMRRKLHIILTCLLCIRLMDAQVAHVIPPDSGRIEAGFDAPEHIRSAALEKEQPTPKAATDSLMKLPRIVSWKISERLGARYLTPMDTVKYNYQQTTVPDGYGVATGFLGNLGSPIISKIFFDRGEHDKFFFYDAYLPYNKNPENHFFYNTRIPYTQLDYQTAGSRDQKEERFKSLLTLNFKRKLNVGFDFDYIYARGFYNAQSAKHLNLTVHANYLSDKVEAHAFASRASITHFENGGIANDAYITNPDSIEQAFGNFTANQIPVRMQKTWNRLKTNQLYLTGRYNLGYRKKAENDSVKGEFVPVASIILTSRYKQQYRRFLSHDTAFVEVRGRGRIRAIDSLYNKNYYPDPVDDSTRFSTMKNTIALSMREGFREWVKFGLTVFAENQADSYSLLDTIGTRRVQHTENSTLIGGVLSKEKGEFFRFNIRADLGVLGRKLGEFRAEGDVATKINIGGKRTSLMANAYIKNLKPNYLEENYHSKYFWWSDKKFGDTRRVYVGGKLSLPFTHTVLTAGIENIQNYIYFGKEKTPVQESKNIQVLMARIDQNLKLGIFNWNNQLVYQTSSNQSVIPVPMLSAYSNLFLKTKIVNELTLQLGLDAHFHTKYYAPGYEPALLQFYNQREVEIGNYPIVTGYANMHLKQTRFFVMFYNLASYVMKPNYFSLPHYPVNPTLFKMGLSVRLYD